MSQSTSWDLGSGFSRLKVISYPAEHPGPVRHGHGHPFVMPKPGKWPRRSSQEPQDLDPFLPVLPQVHTQAGFQVPPGVGAELAIGDAVCEGGSDGGGREGHDPYQLLEASTESGQTLPGSQQGAAVLPHVDIGALGEAWW